MHKICQGFLSTMLIRIKENLRQKIFDSLRNISNLALLLAVCFAQCGSLLGEEVSVILPPFCASLCLATFL